MMISRLVPGPLKPWLRSLRRKVRPRWIRLRRRWISPYFAFGPPEFERLLQRLDVQPGDVVMVHCSFARFEGFRGSLGDAVHALQNAVGSTGGLLMPTLPFSGLAVDYARLNTVLDVKRTPSHMGILSEIFRRMPGVSRSLHPTHPVAGWGAKVPRALGTHRSARTPCGAGSPFEKLVEADGKVLLLGVDVRSMTFFHYLEEELESRMPFSPFTKETFALHVRDERGEVWPVETRLYDPVVAGQRDVRIMVPELKKRGFWREQRVGRLTAILLRCRDVRQVAIDMAAEGRFCYHAMPRGRA
jgi:aminoglycoside 3-N-acetyltransferase